jgi:hypothetical protein
VVRRAHRITFGCPKGKYSPSTELCKVPVQIQKILHPMEEAMLLNPCPLGNPKGSRIKRYIKAYKGVASDSPYARQFALKEARVDRAIAKLLKKKKNPRRDITIEKEATMLFSQGIGAGSVVETLKRKYNLSTDMARYFARRAGAVTRGARKYIAPSVKRSVYPVMLNPKKRWYIGLWGRENSRIGVFSSSIICSVLIVSFILFGPI